MIAAYGLAGIEDQLVTLTKPCTLLLFVPVARDAARLLMRCYEFP
jgi:hypothetical protein